MVIYNFFFEIYKHSKSMTTYPPCWKVIMSRRHPKFSPLALALHTYRGPGSVPGDEDILHQTV